MRFRTTDGHRKDHSAAAATRAASATARVASATAAASPDGRRRERDLAGLRLDRVPVAVLALGARHVAPRRQHPLELEPDRALAAEALHLRRADDLAAALQRHGHVLDR